MSFRNWTQAEADAHNARITANGIKRKAAVTGTAILAPHSWEAPIVERDARPEPLAEDEVQEAGTGQVHVRVTSRRRRLADPDGLCEKYFLDCCRYAGLIAGDAAKDISLETRQQKIGKGQPEETVVEIYRVT